MKVIQMKSVSDELSDIKYQLQLSLNEADIVIMTGGLGPTKDDITKKALSEFLDVPMVLHEETYQFLIRFFTKIGRDPNKMDLIQQAQIPENTLVLANKMGTAPGMWLDAGKGKVIVSLPGVPYEMEYLMENEVIPKLVSSFPSEIILHKTLLVAGIPETTLSQLLESFESSLPPYIKLAYLPALSQIRLRLSCYGKNKEPLENLIFEKSDLLRKILGNHIAGEDDDTLPLVIGRMLKEKNWMLACAESCTGGYVSHLMTLNPGSSQYFKGAIVSYANELKEKSLYVNPQTIEQFGAVSEETVLEMLDGLLIHTNADVGIAISGIAGPDGGTPEKPIGTIWLALGTPDNKQTFLIKAGKNREKNIQYAAYVSLNYLRLFLLN
ncbi:MAG: CinA family nicotinamide mononucleotide deamidase-related protein [Bacteroidetes bacterium]|nr:CinA family nicotinamide mononucleotide deamidase-related protein [Bacteroidota bacterium]